MCIRDRCVTLNIIPDRNWNLVDPAVKQDKLQRLIDVVQLAQALDLPINVGTEMNSFGNKRIDDFNAPELAPVRKQFMDGAYFIYGHTVMQRAVGLGYQSMWARVYLPGRRERNAFYTQMGALVPPGPQGVNRLAALSVEMTPVDMLKQLA